MDAIDRWLDRAAIAPSSLDPGAADVVVLGELNHFVHEKSDFRLALAPRLLQLGYDVWGEELGWSDGTRIDDYLRTRDEQIFESIALFGYRGDVRGDRDDAPTGIFRESLKAYPFALMRAEQQRFYRGLRARGYFGFDVAAGHDGAYADIEALLPTLRGLPVRWLERLRPVPGESITAEIARLEGLRGALAPDAGRRLSAALSARIDGLGYADLVRDAPTYDATRPAMALREEAMKRRFADARALFPNRRMVLLGHAVHLAKDDTRLDTERRRRRGRQPGAVTRRTSRSGTRPAHLRGLDAVRQRQRFAAARRSSPHRPISCRHAQRATGPTLRQSSVATYRTRAR